MSETIEQLTYFVPGVSCGHCSAAITAEVEKLAGVSSVDVDLEAKRVAVAGAELDDDAVRAAIDEAGYDVA
jgi:copper chaperone